MDESIGGLAKDSLEGFSGALGRRASDLNQRFLRISLVFVKEYCHEKRVVPDLETNHEGAFVLK